VETSNAPSGQSGNDLLRLAAVLLRATAVVTIVCAASLAILAGSGAFARYLQEFHLGVGRLWLSGAGALLGCGGFLACRVLEGHSDVAVGPGTFTGLLFVFSVVLLMEWFEVSGATGFRY